MMMSVYVGFLQTSIDSFFGSVEIVMSRKLVLNSASFSRVNFSSTVRLLKWSNRLSTFVPLSL